MNFHFMNYNTAHDSSEIGAENTAPLSERLQHEHDNEIAALQQKYEVDKQTALEKLQL